MRSQLFATFCDDFFDKDVSNMLIYLNIHKNGFDFEAADRIDGKMKKAFEERMVQVERELIEKGQLHSHDNNHTSFNLPKQKNKPVCDSLVDCVREKDCDTIKEWPKYQKIDICWRIP